MRAAAFTDLIGPEGVSVIERDDSEPGPDEALVDVEACAINRHDLWILEGILRWSTPTTSRSSLASTWPAS